MAVTLWPSAGKQGLCGSYVVAKCRYTGFAWQLRCGHVPVYRVCVEVTLWPSAGIQGLCGSYVVPKCLWLLVVQDNDGLDYLIEGVVSLLQSTTSVMSVRR